MQLPHVFIAFFMPDRAFPHVFIAFWDPLGFLLGAHWGLTCNFLMCLLHFSCVIKHFLMCLLHFWHLQASFWVLIVLSWGLLFGMLEGLWSFLGILWVQNGARIIKVKVSKAILDDLGSRRGGQGVSEALQGSIWRRFSSLVARYVVFWCVSCKKCFVHAVWHLDLDS